MVITGIIIANILLTAIITATMVTRTAAATIDTGDRNINGRMGRRMLCLHAVLCVIFSMSIGVVLNSIEKSRYLFRAGGGGIVSRGQGIMPDVNFNCRK